jgi:ABC-type phosphate/phosphonate transport system substrate-binding protein
VVKPVLTTSKFKNMKKLSFLFVALALVGFVTLSSCKSSTQPAEEATEEVVEEAAPEESQEMVDTAAAPMEEGAEEVVE